MKLRVMTIQDYDLVLKLWKSIEGFYIRTIDDSYEGMQKFLTKNPNTNVVAICDNKIVGSILCGYDGRCAYLYHVCVQKEYRHKQIGKGMVAFVKERLKEEGATHINLVAFKNNSLGNLFWHEINWSLKDTLNLYECILDSANTRILNES